MGLYNVMRRREGTLSSLDSAFGCINAIYPLGPALILSIEDISQIAKNMINQVYKLCSKTKLRFEPKSEPAIMVSRWHRVSSSR